MNNIEPNKISTYPKELINYIDTNCNAEELDAFLLEKNYSILCWHCTRLTDYEINKIYSEGLQFPTREFFIEKIKKLPTGVRQSTKDFLIKYIQNRNELQAEKTICASYGMMDLYDDIKCDKIFTMNWGGETIYCAYDKGDNFSDPDLKIIKQELDNVSYPCIVWFSMKYTNLRNSFQGYNTLNQLMLQKDKIKICNSIYIDPCNIEIVRIEKIKSEPKI